MPRGVYDRKKTKASTKAGKVRIPADVVSQLFPGRKTHAEPLHQTTAIPSGGMVLKVTDRKNRVIVTLDINDEGIAVYPTNFRRGKKAQPRIKWSNFTRISSIFNALIQ